jgi:hypothetical protein
MQNECSFATLANIWKQMTTPKNARSDIRTWDCWVTTLLSGNLQLRYFFWFFLVTPKLQVGIFFQHIKMLWNCNVTDRIVDSVRFRILERLYWDDRWIYFELSNVNVEKRLLLLMGCGVLYHFNGEKTHLNYSTLLVPCLPFRPRNINRRIETKCVARIESSKATASFQNYIVCRQNQKFTLAFRKNRVSKNLEWVEND